MEQLEGAGKLDRISPRAYQHPADRAATAALQKVPYLDQVIRKLIALGYERALRAASLGSSVRLGKNQLPRIWVLHRQVFNTLDIERVPDLYMTQFPLANAYTIGTQKLIVVLNSELVRGYLTMTGAGSCWHTRRHTFIPITSCTAPPS